MSIIGLSGNRVLRIPSNRTSVKRRFRIRFCSMSNTHTNPRRVVSLPIRRFRSSNKGISSYFSKHACQVKKGLSIVLLDVPEMHANNEVFAAIRVLILISCSRGCLPDICCPSGQRARLEYSVSLTSWWTKSSEIGVYFCVITYWRFLRYPETFTGLWSEILRNLLIIYSKLNSQFRNLLHTSFDTSQVLFKFCQMTQLLTLKCIYNSGVKINGAGKPFLGTSCHTPEIMLLILVIFTIHPWNLSGFVLITHSSVNIPLHWYTWTLWEDPAGIVPNFSYYFGTECSTRLYDLNGQPLDHLTHVPT